jgi:MFS family permease
MQKSNERWWAIAGPAFAVLFWVAVFTLEPSTPGEKATAEEVVKYYNDHQGQSLADVFLAPLLVTLLVVFIAYFRARIREHERSITSRFAPVVLVVGATVWASGALLGSVGTLAVSAASDHGQNQVAQTVNVLSNSMWIPFIAGIAVTLIGAGLTVLSTGVLPRWLGWVALVAGIVSLAGPGGFLGFFVGPLWVLVAGVLLFLRSDAAVPAPRGDTDVPVSSPRATATT